MRNCDNFGQKKKTRIELYIERGVLVNVNVSIYLRLMPRLVPRHVFVCSVLDGFRFTLLSRPIYRELETLNTLHKPRLKIKKQNRHEAYFLGEIMHSKLKIVVYPFLHLFNREKKKKNRLRVLRYNEP